MDIRLNGETKQFPDGITILGLLEQLQIQHQRVAVELNEMIVKKERYGSTVIRNGDALEVVSFMGGGGARRSRDCKLKIGNCKLLRGGV
jgi:sulfur carrier protein